MSHSIRGKFLGHSFKSLLVTSALEKDLEAFFATPLPEALATQIKPGVSIGEFIVDHLDTTNIPVMDFKEKLEPLYGNTKLAICSRNADEIEGALKEFNNALTAACGGHGGTRAVDKEALRFASNKFEALYKEHNVGFRQDMSRQMFP